MPPAQLTVAAARAALEAEPDSIALRLHLSTLLLDGGAANEALPHVEAVLARDSGNVEALLQATRACEAIGDTARAEQFRELATMLSVGGFKPEPSAVSAASAVSSRLTLADVGGVEHLKQRLQVSFLGPMLDPELRAAYGTSMRGGLLFFGPPGCGKTLLARALAGELRAHFIRAWVPELVAADRGSHLHIASVFELARENSPALVFLDGLEALDGRASTAETSAALGLEMDREEPGEVAVVAASDQPWKIHPSLFGAARFARRMLILPPDRRARVAILRYQLRGRQTDRLNLETVADELDGFSGADIAHVCQAAAQIAGAETPARPVSREDLDDARRLVPRTTNTWFEAARERAVFSGADGMYDDLVVYMRSRRML